MKYAGKYSLGRRLFEAVKDRKVKKRALSDTAVGHGQVFELGTSKAVKRQGATRASKYRSYIEKEDIKSNVYYDKRSIKNFPVEDEEDMRLVFRTVASDDDFPLLHDLAGQEKDTPGEGDYESVSWVAGRFKVLVTFGSGDDQETEIEGLGREHSQLSKDIILLPVANLKQLEEVTEDSLGISDEEQTKVETAWNALDPTKQTEITNLLSPVGQRIEWTTALRRIYGADETAWTVKEDEIGDKDTGLFGKTEGDGGRGEILAGEIFPNLIVIGAAGKEAGIDLFDVIGRQKIEVKEAGNFRIGTKSRQTASTVIDLIKNALRELKPLIIDKKVEILETTREQLVAAMPPVGTGGINQYFESQPWKDFVGKFSGCNECPQRAYAALNRVLEKLKKSPDEEAIFARVIQKINDIYNRIEASLETDINYAYSGELTAARAESTTDYFNIVKIDTSRLNSPIYNDAVNADDTFDLEVITSNIKKAYIDALNPEAAFAGTDIMIVSPNSYVMYTGAQIAEKLKTAAETGIASASGTFTQGTIQLTIDITKEIEKVFEKDLGVTVTGEDGAPTQLKVKR